MSCGSRELVESDVWTPSVRFERFREGMVWWPTYWIEVWCGLITTICKYVNYITLTMMFDKPQVFMSRVRYVPDIVVGQRQIPPYLFKQWMYTQFHNQQDFPSCSHVQHESTSPFVQSINSYNLKSSQYQLTKDWWSRLLATFLGLLDDWTTLFSLKQDAGFMCPLWSPTGKTFRKDQMLPDFNFTFATWKGWNKFDLVLLRLSTMKFLLPEHVKTYVICNYEKLCPMVLKLR